jgi:ankyrin repeat protein
VSNLTAVTARTVGETSREPRSVLRELGGHGCWCPPSAHPDRMMAEATVALDAIRAKVKRGFLAIMQRKIDLSPELVLITPDQVGARLSATVPPPLDRRSNFHACMQDGNTLLHLAVVHDKEAIVKFLLSLPAFQEMEVLTALNQVRRHHGVKTSEVAT